MCLPGNHFVPRDRVGDVTSYCPRLVKIPLVKSQRESFSTPYGGVGGGKG